MNYCSKCGNRQVKLLRIDGEGSWQAVCSCGNSGPAPGAADYVCARDAEKAWNKLNPMTPEAKKHRRIESVKIILQIIAFVCAVTLIVEAVDVVMPKSWKKPEPKHDASWFRV